MGRLCYYDEDAGFVPYTDEPEPQKPITNADRIRAMTDEELAEFMCGCPPTLRGSEECWGRFGCNRCWLDWLKEEIE